MIPKIIHYCWLSNDPIPEDMQNYIKSWKEKLPDYELILWNFDRFDINSSMWVKQAFENKKYAFAADYIRLYAVYNYGGIYMDMDIEVLKSFNDLLSSSIMVAYETEEKESIEAGCFGAEKNNKLIGDCLEYYRDRQFIKKNGSFDTLPLPIIMKKYIPKDKCGMIYSSDYFTCKSNQTGIVSTTKNSYAIHHFAGSWLTDDQRESQQLSNTIYKKIKIKPLAKIIVIIAGVIRRIKKFGLKASIAYWKNR